jgi:hypothetical protein
MYSSNVDKILGRLVSAILAGYFFVFCGCGIELAVGYGTIRRKTREATPPNHPACFAFSS